MAVLDYDWLLGKLILAHDDDAGTSNGDGGENKDDESDSKNGCAYYREMNLPSFLSSRGEGCVEFIRQRKPFKDAKLSGLAMALMLRSFTWIH